MNRRTFALGMTSTLALSACAGSHMVSLDEVNRVGSKIVPILVATSREVKPDGTLGSGRGKTLAFGRYDVSVPPDRKAGQIATSRFTNPRKHFATVSNEIFESEALFRSQITAQLLGKPAGRRDAVIFVHGYNTSYKDGLFLFAQFYTDLGLTEAPVHYSWPSAEKLFRYGYDRDSMLYARDGFERTLRNVVQAGADRVLIVGHSMGTMLVMETLREIAIAKDDYVRNRIGGVILVSPDIDIDVFRGQVKRIGKLPQPFVVFGSRKDRVLSFASAEIYGDSPRLGNLPTTGALADLDVTVVDVTQYSQGLLNHRTAIESPAFLKIARNMRTFTRAFGAGVAAAGDLPEAFISVEDAYHFQLGGI